MQIDKLSLIAGRFWLRCYNHCMKNKYTMKTKIWLYPGMAGWHFVYIDKKISKKIRAEQKKQPRRGWGSVPVRATVGKTKWDTSIFPDEEGPYLLPVKAQVRKKEGIGDGDTIMLSIQIRRYEL